MRLNLTCKHARSILASAIPYWIAGLGGPNRSGAEAMRRKSRGFFIASRLMMGGIWGAARLAGPDPGPPTRMSSIAQCLAALVDGLKTFDLEFVMNKHTQVAPSAFVISNISIKQDAEGRYCLNDLHKASGSHNRHRPSIWIENQQTKDLIAEIELEAGIPAIKTIKGHRATGTYVVK